MDGIAAPPAPASAARSPPTASAVAAAKTAKEFEAVFLGQMTQAMMESVDTGDAFSGGHGEQMFRGVMAEKLGTAIAERGGLGLAPAVMEQIIRLQEASR